MGQYDSIVGQGATFAGVDQGIDFTGAFDILAPADAIVTRALVGGSGWPGQGAVINLRLLNGPAAGRYVYVAEDLVPNVTIGQRVSKGAVIGRATGSGKAPGIEYGWAMPSGIPLAPRPAPRPAPQYTPQGANFQQFATVIGGGSSLASGGGNFSVSGAIKDAAGIAIPGSGVITGAVGGVSGVVSGISDTAHFLGKLTDPHFILRGLQVIAGGVLVLVGIVLLTRQVGLAVAQSDTGKAVLSGAAKTPVAGAVIEASGQKRAYSQGQTQGRRAGARREGRKAGQREISSRTTIDTRPKPVYGKKRGTNTYGDVPY